jgi:hypothetical protein
MFVVWSVHDILGLIVWGIIALIFAGLGILILVENVKHRIQRLFGLRK